MRPPTSTRTDTRLPDTTLFRSTVSVFVLRLFCRRHRREAEWSFPRVGTIWKSSRGKPSHRLSSLSGQDHCSLSYGGFRKWNLVELCFNPNKGGKRADDSRVNYGTACTRTRGVGARLSHSHGDDHAGKSIRPDDSGNSCRDAGHFLFHGCLSGRIPGLDRAQGG